MPMPGCSTPRLWLAAFFFVLTSVSLLPYVHQLNGAITDEACDLLPARRILQGQVPYRDFDTNYAFGTPLLGALAFAALGVNITAARLLMVVCGGVIGALMFLASDRLVRRPFSLMPPLLFLLVCAPEWPIVSHRWTGAACLLGFVNACLVYGETARPAWAMLAGIAAGLCGTCMQTDGAVAVLAFALLLRGLPSPRRAFGAFACGLALVWLPVVAFALVSGALAPAWRDLVVDARNIASIRTALYSLRPIVDAWSGILSHMPVVWNGTRLVWLLQAVTMATTWTLKYAFYFPLLGVAMWRLRASAWRVVLVVVVLWTAVSMQRLDLLNQNYLMALGFILLGGLADAWWALGWRRAVATGCLTIMALCLTYWGWSMRDAWRASYPINSQMGLLWTDDPRAQRDFRDLLAGIDRVAPPASPFFTFPLAPSLYLLSGTVNPTRLDYLIPFQNPRPQVDAVARTLHEAGPPWLLYLPLPIAQTLSDYPAIRRDDLVRELDYTRRVLTADYEVGEEVGSAVFYRRKSAAP